MLSSRLVQVIEDHSEKIAERVVRQIQRDAKTPHMARLPEAELRARAQEILKKLGHWLAASDEEEIARHFEHLGRLRAQEEIPLHEVVHALHVLKEKMLDHVRDQGLSQSTVELYAEEELEHQVGAFFDSVVYHVVHSYEGALRRVAQMGV